MNFNTKKCLALLMGAILLFPACSNRAPVRHVIHTHVLVAPSSADQQDTLQLQQSIKPVSVKNKKKKRILKKRNRRPILGTVKALLGYSLGVAAVIGATACVIVGMHAPLEALAPAVVCAGVGTTAYMIGKSGYEDLTGQRDMDDSSVKLSLSAEQRIVL